MRVPPSCPELAVEHAGYHWQRWHGSNIHPAPLSHPHADVPSGSRPGSRLEPFTELNYLLRRLRRCAPASAFESDASDGHHKRLNIEVEPLRFPGLATRIS